MIPGQSDHCPVNEGQGSVRSILCLLLVNIQLHIGVGWLRAINNSVKVSVIAFFIERDFQMVMFLKYG